MIEILIGFLNDKTILFGQMVLGVIFAVILLSLFFLKSSRDERGRTIVGKASIVSAIYFMIIVTVFSHILQLPIVEMNTILAVAVLQFIYNTVVLVEIIAIFILKKRI